ncbi:biotin transporter BioY [Hydrogenophaga sp. BPS33]|uniref:biotin transporter BioY n=1 Tax=Hydrogenophaga sp. BPS33 TaxID=2651974 RepID=UPI00131F9F5D|nr:biotin transporter BioY [Hydrogenophaga sp. BPS33]QHE83855.1 biotin transporter BioY [Hydrogenophaga sp. BPS33]
MNKSSFSLALIALFAALLAVFGLIPKIDLPFGVPITLQTLGVMLAGCLLGPRRGLQAMLLFLAAVALGLPLLSGGRGGIGVFFAPSAGYLLGWPLGAFVAGCIMAVLPTDSPRRAAASAFVASVVGGLLVIHACGVIGLVTIAHLSWLQALTATLAFVPGDLVKCVVCAMAVHTVARGLPDWKFGGRSAT